MPPRVVAHRTFVLAAALLCLGTASRTAGATQTGPAADISQQLQDWTVLNGTCRGGRGDEPATLAACDRRDALHQRLTALSWCYGRPGEAGYQRAWHPCAGPER